VVSPRVVVVEIQEVWDWTEVKTRPYRENHVSASIPEMGASLAAFVHLAEKKGLFFLPSFSLLAFAFAFAFALAWFILFGSQILS